MNIGVRLGREGCGMRGIEWLALVLAIAPSWGQTGAQVDLGAASLEDLMGVKVTSVGRKDQKLSKAAAAVYVLTQEDIRRSGAASLAEALRLVPGMQVARISSSQWAISGRGFNGRFANKLLVLIDGRSVYNNIHAGVFWDQNDVMVEDIERIEVIRGPGATMWGANAVNGIINIITKSSRETQGGMVALRSGVEDRGYAAMRYGGRHGENLTYRIFGRYSNRASFLMADGERSGDTWNTKRGGFRMDWERDPKNSLLLMGDGYQGDIGQRINGNFPLPQQGSGVMDDIGVSGGSALFRWTHRRSERSEYVLQSTWSLERRGELMGKASLGMVDVDLSNRFTLNRRHELVWGVGYRFLYDQVTDNGRARTPEYRLLPDQYRLLFDPAERRDQVGSAFVQDDIAIIPDRVIVSVGTKLQHNPYSGLEVQPSVRMLWSPNAANGLWGAVSRAVRTPARRDHDIRIPFALPVGMPGSAFGVMTGTRDYDSETLLSYEAGYRRMLGRTVSLDLALFSNQYRRLQNITLGNLRFEQTALILPIGYGNEGSITTQGGELALAWTPHARWRLHSSYSLLGHRGGNGTTPGIGLDFSQTRTILGGSARHQAQVRSLVDLPKRWNFDATAFYVSALPQLQTPAYTRLDVRFARRLGEALELSFGATNLLQPRHAEYVSEDFVVRGFVRRSFFVQTRWSF